MKHLVHMTPSQAEAVKKHAILTLNRGIDPDTEYAIVLQPAINRPAFIRTKETVLLLDEEEHHVFYKLSEIAGIELCEKEDSHE